MQVLEQVCAIGLFEMKASFLSLDLFCMLTLKLRYNLIYLAFTIFLLLGGVVCLGLFVFGLTGLIRINDNSDYFGMLIAIPVFFMVSIPTLRYKVFNISIDNEWFELNRPFIGGGRCYALKEIKGFSRSKVNYGASNWSYAYRKNSLIVYFTNGMAVELTPRSYPLRFYDIEPSLRKLGIPFLGYEPYKVTFFGKRLYKY
jgi:hypothetical protein